MRRALRSNIIDSRPVDAVAVGGAFAGVCAFAGGGAFSEVER
jgi:hypothetical protein